MSTSSQPNPAAASALGVGGSEPEGATPQDTGPTVGSSDAAADAARTGADTDGLSAARDSDGVPVGDSDAEADAVRSGADRDEADR
jgi:hypothetical protein